MNIVKLQDMLRSVPDQALIGYVQQPNGEVPSYLALTELQRRKDMRDKYAQQQAPESSVAEDLQQEATQQDQGGLAMLAGQPQSEGIADLPVDDSMYQEQSFAGGGIVAFAGPQGSYVVGDQDYTDDYRAMREWEAQQALRDKYPSMANQKAPKVRTPYDDAIAYYKSPEVRNQTALAFDKDPTPAALRVLERRREAWLAGQKDPFTKDAPVGSKYNPQGIYTPPLTTEEQLDKLKADQAKRDLPPTVDEKKPVTDDKKKIVTDKKKDVLPATTEKPVVTQPETEEEALRKRMAIYKEFMGGDADKQALKDKLDAMEARAKRQEDLAPWMAVTEAGFKTMSGTSPFALANLGAGAEAGLKSYGAAQDKLATLEEKRYALMNDAAKADRAEKQAAIQFGENSYQHKAAMDQKERLTNAALDLDREKLKVTERIADKKLNAITGKGGASTLKAQAESIIKMNKNIDEQLALLVASPNQTDKIKQMIANLQAEKKKNEDYVKKLYQTGGSAPGGMANVDLSAYKVKQILDDE